MGPLLQRGWTDVSQTPPMVAVGLVWNTVWLNTEITLGVGVSISGFLIITRGKTACIDDAHYAKYPHFRGASGGWHASEAAVNCQVVNSPCRHTSSRLCPQHFNCHPNEDCLLSPPSMWFIHVCPTSDASSFSGPENEQEWQRGFWLTCRNH